MAFKRSTVRSRPSPPMKSGSTKWYSLISLIQAKWRLTGSKATVSVSTILRYIQISIGEIALVYGIIDKKSKAYYTYLADVFDAFDNEQSEFNWLITDTEIVAKSKELDILNTNTRWENINGKPVPVPAPEFNFISGEELTKIIRNDDSQWIWGVLSGFKKEISLDEILRYPLPVTESNSFWKNPPSIQHPLASVEIVPFDSSFVLFFSKSKEMAERFRTAFPECQDLSEYNVLSEVD